MPSPPRVLLNSLAGQAKQTVEQREKPMTSTTLAADPDVLARVTWAFITEASDGVAGELIAEHGAEAALDVLRSANSSSDSDDLRTLRERALPRLNSDRVDQLLLTGARFGATILTPSHDHWPTRLNDLGKFAPHALWVRGNTALLAAQDQIGIVGSRAATPYGQHTTMEIASSLVERGYTITSGAAFGVDGMAHRAALAARGNTIAYLAGGVDRFYPSGHDALLSKIAEVGAVVSEEPPSTAPTRWRFLARNRLIAGASRSLVVTEAGIRSGSMNTAGHAAAIGRPLGAVPGPVTSATSAGCHRLIRDFGATLVTNAEEVLEL